MFNLLSYVHSNDYKHAFEVELGKGKSVAALKKAIKEEKTQHSVTLMWTPLSYGRHLFTLTKISKRTRGVQSS